MLVRIFGLDVGEISSDSMLQTIKKGDWIIIDKISYGLSLPVSMYEVPWLSYFSASSEKELWNCWRKKKRILTTSVIPRGDIIIFRLPTNTKRLCIKRIIGLPGETITLGFGKRVNNRMPIDSVFTQNKYYFYIDNSAVKSTYIKIDTTHKDVFENSQNLLSDDYVDINLSKYFVHYDWTLDNFGPLFIPKKGSEIFLNDSIYNLYKQELTLYEGNVITKQNSIYICNGQKISKYRFKFDYYFLLGDNLTKSCDSRCFGLIPAYLIIGKIY